MTQEERTLGMLAHLGGLAKYLFPFGNILAPLIVLILKKDESAFVEDQAREALNFQINITILYLISLVLIFVAVGIILLPMVLLIDLVMLVIASIKSYDYEYYRYPVNIRFVA